MSKRPSGGLQLELMWRITVVFHKGEERLLELGKNVTALTVSAPSLCWGSWAGGSDHA